MFDIIGKVVDVNMRTSASGLFSWKEIVVRECSAEGVIDSEKEVNDIPLMFHSVSNCGARKFTVAVPVESVIRYSKRPVGFISVRSATSG